MTKLLTANALRNGAVVWWTGTGWSHNLSDAAPLDEGAGASTLAEQARSEDWSDLALIDAEPAPAGGFRPTHIRERIRSHGPTVRPDLALPLQDWR